MLVYCTGVIYLLLLLLLFTCVYFAVVFQLLLLKGCPAHPARVRFVSGVGPADVAVVGRVGGEGLPAVFALEGPLAGVLPDVRAQNARGGKSLKGKQIHV